MAGIKINLMGLFRKKAIYFLQIVLQIFPANKKIDSDSFLF